MTGSRELRKEWVRPIPYSSKEDGLREMLCFFLMKKMVDVETLTELKMRERGLRVLG